MMLRGLFPLALFLIPSGCSLFEPAELGGHEDFKAEFDLVWQSFDQQYAGFGFTDVDWDELYQAFSARIDTVTCQEGFASVLLDMLAQLQDPAILIWPPMSAPDSSFSPGIEPNCDYDVLMSYLEQADFQWFQQGSWGYSVFQDSIPYIVILNWTYGIYPQDFSDLLELYPNAPALVIDQRLAAGGVQTQIRHIGMRFNDQMRIGFYTVGRDGPSHGDLCDPIPYYVYSVTGHFDKPVAVLIGESNSGAAQRFACMADEIPSVTLIGDTTLIYANSSSGDLGLPAGWSYTAPDSTVLLADSITWLNGNGVLPDIYVEATAEDFAQGIDPVLEYAVNWAASQKR
jgi:carboxyl-terminal processing protease